MEINELQTLLERYWEGKTSVDEEREIKVHFLQNQPLPPELERWRSLFSGISEISALPNADFDEKILAAIDAEENANIPKTRKLWYRISAAACIAILIFAGIKFYLPAAENNGGMSDKEAAEIAKAFLFHASSELNKAQTEAKNQLEILGSVAPKSDLKQ
ncbi:MAG: hypothetical protein LBR64_02600 [Dysgonamonadaceae bacterium]|jgi:hypothetical protein|nr:hypothetical protein [Dysgonamonadaceae bacterium]